MQNLQRTGSIRFRIFQIIQIDRIGEPLGIRYELEQVRSADIPVFDQCTGKFRIFLVPDLGTMVMQNNRFAHDPGPHYKVAIALTHGLAMIVQDVTFLYQIIQFFPDREFALDLSGINVRKIMVEIRMPAFGTGDY
jgi:hypothetical protein